MGRQARRFQFATQCSQLRGGGNLFAQVDLHQADSLPLDHLQTPGPVFFVEPKQCGEPKILLRQPGCLELAAKQPHVVEVQVVAQGKRRISHELASHDADRFLSVDQPAHRPPHLADNHRPFGPKQAVEGPDVAPLQHGTPLQLDRLYLPVLIQVLQRVFGQVGHLQFGLDGVQQGEGVQVATDQQHLAAFGDQPAVRRIGAVGNRTPLVIAEHVRCPGAAGGHRMVRMAAPQHAGHTSKRFRNQAQRRGG